MHNSLGKENPFLQSYCKHLAVHDDRKRMELLLQKMDEPDHYLKVALQKALNKANLDIIKFILNSINIALVSETELRRTLTILCKQNSKDGLGTLLAKIPNTIDGNNILEVEALVAVVDNRNIGFLRCLYKKFPNHKFFTDWEYQVPIREAYNRTKNTNLRIRVSANRPIVYLLAEIDDLKMLKILLRDRPITKGNPIKRLFEDAVEYGRLSIAEYLIQKYRDVLEDVNLSYDLIRAAEAGYTSTLKRFKASINKLVPGRRYDIFQAAVKGKQLDTAIYLIDQRICWPLSRDDEHLMEAARLGDIAMLKLLLEHGAIIYREDELILNAIESGSVELVKYLVEEKGLGTDEGKLDRVRAAKKSNIDIEILRMFLLSAKNILTEQMFIDLMLDGIEHHPWEKFQLIQSLAERALRRPLQIGIPKITEVISYALHANNFGVARNLLQVPGVALLDLDHVFQSAVQLNQEDIMMQLLELVGVPNKGMPFAMGLQFNDPKNKLRKKMLSSILIFASKDKKYVWDKKALEIVMGTPNEWVACKLLKHGAEFNDWHIADAIERNLFKVARRMILIARDQLSTKLKTNALTAAVKTGNKAMVQWLLDRRFPTQVEDKKVFICNREIYDCLKLVKISSEGFDFSNRFMFLKALTFEDVDLAKQFLERGMLNEGEVLRGQDYLHHTYNPVLYDLLYQGEAPDLKVVSENIRLYYHCFPDGFNQVQKRSELGDINSKSFVSSNGNLMKQYDQLAIWFESFTGISLINDYPHFQISARQFAKLRAVSLTADKMFCSGISNIITQYICGCSDNMLKIISSSFNRIMQDKVSISMAEEYQFGFIGGNEATIKYFRFIPRIMDARLSWEL